MAKKKLILKRKPKAKFKKKTPREEFMRNFRPNSKTRFV